MEIHICSSYFNKTFKNTTQFTLRHIAYINSLKCLFAKQIYILLQYKNLFLFLHGIILFFYNLYFNIHDKALEKLKYILKII